MINLVVINSGGIVSGAEIILRQYLKSLPNDFKVSLIIAKEPSVVDFFDKSATNIHLITVPFFVKKRPGLMSRVINIFNLILETFITAFILADLSRKNQLNIVYCNNTLASIIVGHINKLNLGNYQAIFHIYDIISSSTFRGLFQSIAEASQAVIAPSKAGKEDILKCTNLAEQNVHIIYNGVEINNQSQKNRPEVDRNNLIVLGFAGSLTERKGLLYLAEAYEIIKRKFTNIKLIIAANFKEDEYEKKINDILTKCAQVEIVTLPHEQMENFYRSIDILVVPSLNDPFPTTVLEALSFGKIVIGSDVDGIPEMLEQEYLFLPASAESIVIKVEDILNNFLFHQWLCREQNPRKIAEKFSLEDTHKLINNLIQEIAINQKR